MKKTAEEILKEKLTSIGFYSGLNYSEGLQKYTIEAMYDFAAQEVAERNQQMRDFLFNMHEVENDKVVFNLSDLLQFFPPPATTNELEKSYNAAETECMRLIGVLQDKVMNLKSTGKNWGNVAELNRVKIGLNEINDNF